MADEKSEVVDPRGSEVMAALAIALGFVVATRLPFVRSGPIESDEFGFLAQMDASWMPMNHSLFKALGRAFGVVFGGSYQGLLALDILVSGLALVSLWWWLRALVRPSTASAMALVVGVAPLFWSQGELAANYTMIPLVGSFLLGVAYRGWQAPRAWHPYAAAVVLAFGTGYREDIGTDLLPVFFLIVWNHRWKPALGALTLFTILNLAWLLPMLQEAGGLAEYRRKSAEFAYSAGFKNSVFYLGFVDAPVRYAAKIGLAFFATFGIGLVFIPRGLIRLVRLDNGRKLAGLLALSMAPALGSHLMVHFGMAGYSFFYLPSLAALLALGAGRATRPMPMLSTIEDRAPIRLLILAGLLGAVFLFYPTDIKRPGWRGDFDLAIGRYTRVGLQENLAERTNSTWRTKNSVQPRIKPSTEEGDRSTMSGND